MVSPFLGLQEYSKQGRMRRNDGAFNIPSKTCIALSTPRKKNLVDTRCLLLPSETYAASNIREYKICSQFLTKPPICGFVSKGTANYNEHNKIRNVFYIKHNTIGVVINSHTVTGPLCVPIIIAMVY